jgi:CheY-like chemotaxis protein
MISSEPLLDRGSGPGPSRIVIADDHPLFRDALKQMLRERSDLEVVGEASDGREALELCRQLRPDLVLMDLRMPGMGGLEATCAIKRELPQVVVLILTAFEDEKHLAEAIRAGAAGYTKARLRISVETLDVKRGELTQFDPANSGLHVDTDEVTVSVEGTFPHRAVHTVGKPRRLSLT